MGASEEISDARMDEILRRSKEEARNDVRGKALSFDLAARALTLELESGLRLTFDAAQLDELRGASDAELAQVAISRSGLAIVCDPLDVHISIKGLVLELTLGQDWAEALRGDVFREAARQKSEAARVAARENGKKGGRPRKVVAETTGRTAIGRAPKS